MQNMDQQLVRVIMKLSKLKSKIWSAIVENVGLFLDIFLLMFLWVILEMFALCWKVLWSPAVALKFYVVCTVFNDLN